MDGQVGLAAARAGRALKRVALGSTMAIAPSAFSPAQHTRAPWRGALAGGLFGLGVALFFFAPAHWLAAHLGQASGGRLRLSDAQGTVWAGSGQLSLHGGQGSNDASVLPGRVQWRLIPALGALDLELRADCCTPEGLKIRIVPSWSGARLQVADRQSHWSAQWLAGLGTPWNTIRPEGKLLLQSSGFVVQWDAGRWSWKGALQIDALDMASRLSTVRPMGSYRLRLQEGSASQLQLSTLQGGLQLQGSGQWTGSKWRFEGEASAAPEREEALTNLLNIIGQRRGARSIIKLG